MDPRAPVPRYFCHSCNVDVRVALQALICPYCSGDFIEQLEDDQESNVGGVNTDRQNVHRPITTGQITDVGIDELDDPPPPDNRTNDRWSNWSPPWNYRDENTPASANLHTQIGNDLAFLMSGERIRTMGISRTESLLQQLMWQVTGGRAGVPPVLLVGSDPNDYAMANEGIDAILSQLLWHSDNDGPPPLAQDIIDGLPEVTVSEEQVLSKLQCSVCWEVYNPEEKVRQLKCGHIYHKDCIFPWLNLHATCPICRQSLSPPDGPESEQRSASPRDGFGPNFQNLTVIPSPSIAALLFRACRDPPSANAANSGGPAATGSAPANPTPSSSVPFSPAPADAAPNTSATSEFSIFNNASDNTAPPTSVANSTNTTNTSQQNTTTNANPTTMHLISSTIGPGLNRVVLMSSTPNGPLERNLSDYFTILSNGAPISSSTVSSTTSDVNSRRSPVNFDMDLE